MAARFKVGDYVETKSDREIDERILVTRSRYTRPGIDYVSMGYGPEEAIPYGKTCRFVMIGERGTIVEIGKIGHPESNRPSGFAYKKVYRIKFDNPNIGIWWLFYQDIRKVRNSQELFVK